MTRPECVLSDYLRLEHIFTDISAPDKAGALNSICRLAAPACGLSPGLLFEALMDREKTGSTGIGLGVALPHGSSPLMDSPLAFLATAKNGVDFDSPDGRPVRLFVMLIGPPAGGGGHLRLLSRLGAMLKSPEAVGEFLAAESPGEIFQLILKRQ